MEETNIINEIVTTILKDRTDIRIQIAYSDDLHRDAVRVCENPVCLEYLKGMPQQAKADMNQRGGVYILPKDLQSRQFILINSAVREDGYSHLMAIAQEVLHAKNHTIFCEKYCGGDVDKIAGHPSNRSFRIWDAFDARRTSHRFYLTLVLQQLYGYELADVTNLLQQQELPARLQEINTMLAEPNSDDLYQRIAKILGMFHVWETGYGISIAPHMNMWCYTLYEALKKYGAIGVVNFHELDDAIQQLWAQRMI